MVGQVLGAIANAQQRQTAFKGRYIHLRRIGLPDGTGAAGKDNTLYRGVQRRNLVIRIDFTENIEFPKAASDKLRHLRAEVQNKDFIHAVKKYSAIYEYFSNYC